MAQSRQYEALAGLVEAAVVEDAASAFRDAWDGPLDAWQSSLASLGEATVGAAGAITATDQAGSQAWSSLSARINP